MIEKDLGEGQDLTADSSRILKIVILQHAMQIYDLWGCALAGKSF